jgi:asparagine synthase (glutamine-hydrolysing)
MCGFTGIMCGFIRQPEIENNLKRMTECLRHRGPDDCGAWVEHQGGIAFGHRRLAVIDLSEDGHQPMISHSGRFVIAYNGEVYNFKKLRSSLEKESIALRGHSDTRVVLETIGAWGLEEALRRFIGMFAFALWDRKERKLCLVRDRLGIKPLYYGWVNGAFVFGSELKAITAYPGFGQPIDRKALALFMRYNCIPAPYSIYEGISKLLPGHIAQLSWHTKNLEIKEYWSARSVVEQGLMMPFEGSDDETVEQLDTLLRDAVKCRMISDVPLGAFLSGGIDSSTVVALMQAQSSLPVRTFSIGSADLGFNEAEDAKAVANYLGTDHTELYVTSEQAMEVIPKLPTLYDEPFADSSQIPTFLVSKLARKHVTVSLSGDGGDELFGGYNRHTWAPRIWNRVGYWPQFFRKGLSIAIGYLSPESWDALFEKINFLFLGKFDHRILGYKMQKLAEILLAGSAAEMYKILTSHWKDPSALVLGGEEPLAMWSNPEVKTLTNDFAQHMMLMDLITYLPDDILTKVDRASMGVSLEARVPLLDHRVVEFAWRLPLSMKIRNGQGKWPLRQVLYKYVPRELVERPKSGFGIPIDSWLRGPLRDWAEALLDESRLRQEGFFNPAPIRQKWAEHLSGKRNWAYHLWDVLMFQGWLERNT